MSNLVKREKYTNSKGRRSLKVIVLDLICFSFFAWFTAQNVPKTSAKFGQETKNEGQDNEHPTLQKRIRNESINLAQYKITCYAHHHIAQAHITKHEHETNLDSIDKISIYKLYNDHRYICSCFDFSFTRGLEKLVKRQITTLNATIFAGDH